MMKFLKITIIALTCTCFNGLLLAQHMSISEKINKGLYNEALTDLNKEISKNPKDTKNFMMLADIQTKLGKLELACATYSAVESMGASSDELYYAYGLALKMQGKYDQAIDKFGKCKNASKELAQKQIQSCVFAKELIKTDDVKRVMNMDFNSPQDEFGLSFYNNMLVFCSGKKPFMTDLTANALKDKCNVYPCKTLINGTAAALFIEDKEIPAMEAIHINEQSMITYSLSSTSLPHLSARMISSKIYIGEYNGYNVENMTEWPYNSNDYSNYSSCFNKEGNKLIFASNMPGGMGGFDLYVSNFENNKWSTPVNLGDDINTSSDEITPFYSDGMLWFASNGHNGLGGFDICSAQQVDDYFLNVQNMGIGINSEKNDLFPNVKNLVMYFTSDRDESKQLDIYRSPLSERHYTIEINDQSFTRTVTSAEVIEETPPPAYALESYAAKGVDGAKMNEILSGARRVSLSEVTVSDKPKVFFIQLASVSNLNNAVTKKYKSLVKFGNIYQFKINNISKIRLGYFMERDETDRLLSIVRKNGFKDAFVVEQELANSSMELLLSQTGESTTYTTTPTTTHQSSTGTTSSTSTNTKTPSTTTSSTTASTYSNPTNIEDIGERQYKVRLGAYEDPIWFDNKKAQDLGKLEQWTKGGWTIFILSGFQNYENADKARIQAINRGFVDAEVVIDNGGIIERIRKN